MISIAGTPLVAGTAHGPSLRLDEPISFWGGVDPRTGTIIDPHHPQVGRSLTSSVVVMPHGRGSSSGAGVLAEALRAGTGPCAIVLQHPDPILVVGSLVATELSPSVRCPVVICTDRFGEIDDGRATTIGNDGQITQA